MVSIKMFKIGTEWSSMLIHPLALLQISWTTDMFCHLYNYIQINCSRVRYGKLLCLDTYSYFDPSSDFVLNRLLNNPPIVLKMSINYLLDLTGIPHPDSDPDFVLFDTIYWSRGWFASANKIFLYTIFTDVSVKIK